jgi:hypothetical protein
MNLPTLYAWKRKKKKTISLFWEEGDILTLATTVTF